MGSRLRRAGIALGLVAACCLGCAGERAALLRGQAYYEDNQFERALAVWRNLERQEADLSPSDFARYAYLRGMTDYRLGFHLDARHWLGLARVSHQQSPSALDTAWSSRLDSALADLDRRAFGLTGGDVDAVQSIEAAPGSKPPAAPAPGPAAPGPAAPGAAAPTPPVPTAPAAPNP